MTEGTEGIRTGDFFYDTRVYLEFFDRFMRKEKMTKRFHRQNWENIFDYLSYYVTKGEERDISEWCSEVDDFMMNGFLKQDRTISIPQLDSMCASLRHFHKCMLYNAVLTSDEYDRVKAALRDNRDKWYEARAEREKALDGKKKFRRPRGIVI